MALNENDVARVKHVLSLASKMKSELDLTVRHISEENGTISFFTSKDGSGTPLFSFNFPTEFFLNQVGTGLVNNFTWSALTYPNSTNPNLDGKAVFVMAVKGDDDPATVHYSFADLSSLIDIYLPADPSISIAGNSIAVNISGLSGNILELKNDGLFVGSQSMAIAVDGAVEGNFAIFGASGELIDSGYTFVSDADFNAAMSSIFG